MSKVILVMDKPEGCLGCPMCNDNDDCVLQDEDENYAADTWDDLMINCPLRKLPEKHNVDAGTVGEEWAVFNKGWNACIDKILGD